MYNILSKVIPLCDINPIFQMHNLTLAPYIKNTHTKLGTYNDLHICNKMQIQYWCWFNYALTVNMFQNNSKIPNNKGISFNIYKNLTSIKISYKCDGYNSKLYYEK